MQVCYSPKPAKTWALLLAPLTGLTGSVLWVKGGAETLWPNLMWASFILFIPTCYQLNQLLKTQSPKLTWWAGTLNIIGCAGCIGQMNLFRFNAVYPYHGSRYFADMLMNAMDKNLIGALTYLPALMFPVSYVLFGIATIKSRLMSLTAGVLMIVFGILFWLGNAGESDLALISCYAAGSISFFLVIISLKSIIKDDEIAPGKVLYYNS